jgi:folate-binding protein YgfZ
VLIPVPGGALPACHADPAEELAAGLEAAVLVDRSTGGRLRLDGGQRLDYLQRISAQDFRDLVPGQGVRAAVLERRGKIVDVVTAHAFADHLLLLTSAALRGAIADWVRKFVLRDDVQVDDQSEGTGELVLLGPRARQVAVAVAGEAAASLEPHGWLEHPTRPGTFLLRDAPGGWNAFRLVGPAATMGELWSELLESAGGDLHPAGEEAYQALRVLAGVPEGGAEIGPGTNPMELGLDDSYSLSKGCYTGQEVLAKMNTHQSIKRRLVGLEIGGQVALQAGDSLHAAGAAAGRATTVAPLPGSARTVALALVRVEHAAPGTVLHHGDGGEARVVPLPFPLV